MKAQKLPFSFYRRETELVARELLGKILVHRLKNGEKRMGRIVETEAYLGIEDPACHTFGGRRTPRTETMYRAGGYSYVYLIYGMHHCFNVVTREEGEPEAVLIRAIEPVQAPEPLLVQRSGPGKLCKQMDITRRENGISLTSASLHILEVAQQETVREIVQRPRIGVDYAGEAARWPLRFYLKDNPFVSRP